MKRKPNNPRQISKREFERLAADLERFGDLGGVVHNETTGNFVGGNQRSSVFELERQGAQITVTETYAEPTRTGTVARGYVEWRGERYDYRRVRWDTETEDAACLVANLRGGTWDFDALSAWNGDLLKGIGFDGDLLAAWNDQAANLRELLESEKPEPVEDAGAQVDKAEELREKWGVETGHLWQLGEHRLICGDCTDGEVVARVMGGEKADAVLTDPPYGIGDLMHGGTWAKKADIEFSKMREWDKDTSQEFFDLILACGVPSIVWGGNYFITPASRCWLVWDKPEFPTMSSAELAWTNLDHNTKRFEYGRTYQAECQKDHPTQKPVALMDWCLSFVETAKIIYDPFSGSGTTIIACERLGRKCRAIEISPAYCAVAIERWVQTTGGTPVLISS